MISKLAVRTKRERQRLKCTQIYRFEEITRQPEGQKKTDRQTDRHSERESEKDRQTDRHSERESEEERQTE